MNSPINRSKHSRNAMPNRSDIVEKFPEGGLLWKEEAHHTCLLSRRSRETRQQTGNCLTETREGMIGGKQQKVFFHLISVLVRGSRPNHGFHISQSPRSLHQSCTCKRISSLGRDHMYRTRCKQFQAFE